LDPRQVVEEPDHKKVENLDSRQHRNAEEKSKQATDVRQQSYSPECGRTFQDNELIVSKVNRHRRSADVAFVLVVRVLKKVIVVVIDRVAGWQAIASLESIAVFAKHYSLNTSGAGKIKPFITKSC
jgi:hypothetical protein